MNKTLLLLALLVWSIQGKSQDNSKYIVDFTGTFTHFEQQIKTEIGGTKGELLIADTEFTAQFIGLYRLSPIFSAGWYVQEDIGNRENAQFDSFDEKGATKVVNLQGGRFTEFWTGPIVRAQYSFAFAEVGYGLVGFRNDKARTAILNKDGEANGDFTTSPTVAWLGSVGFQGSLTEYLNLQVKLQYRVRYYNKKGGVELAQEAVHGTQNLTPMVGFSYAW